MLLICSLVAHRVFIRETELAHWDHQQNKTHSQQKTLYVQWNLKVENCQGESHYMTSFEKYRIKLPFLVRRLCGGILVGLWMSSVLLLSMTWRDGLSPCVNNVWKWQKKLSGIWRLHRRHYYHQRESEEAVRERPTNTFSWYLV